MRPILIALGARPRRVFTVPLWLTLVGLVSVLACSDDGGGATPVDSGTDEGVDVPPDVETDATEDMTPDLSLDDMDPTLDSDEDGLTDIDELTVWGTSPDLADTDGDGFEDGEEISELGFDPNRNPLRFNPRISDIPVIDIEVTLGEGVSLDRFGPNARVFLFARAPGTRQPIAVDQRMLSEIPGRFALTDANAMLGGSLAQFESVDVVARISSAGTATEQPGDAYAQATVSPASDEVVHLVIDQIVPDG